MVERSLGSAIQNTSERWHIRYFERVGTSQLQCKSVRFWYISLTAILNELAVMKYHSSFHRGQLVRKVDFSVLVFRGDVQYTR